MDDVTLFAVAGDPVLKSRKPAMLQCAFDATGMKALCIPLAMRSAEETVATIRQLHIRGAVITAPFRKQIIPFLDELDDSVRTKGSVDIVLNRGGRLGGFYASCRDTLESPLPDSSEDTAEKRVTDAPLLSGRLLAEGARAFCMLTGREAPLAEMEKALHGGDSPDLTKMCMIGFMGAGKSTVGPIVAARLSIPHVDMDTRIEERTGRTVTQIFRESGEDAFRRHEKKEIKDILGGGRCVVSAGGGTVLDTENLERIKASSFVVWLFAGLEETLLRIGTDESRPLAAASRRIEDTFRDRIPLYARASHMLVKTDGASIEEVAKRIVYESDKSFTG